MKILAHRGNWKYIGEKNSEKALISAVCEGFGIETDFRDYRGNLVVSHDIATEKALPASDLFREIKKMELAPFMAMNVKADGLSDLMLRNIREFAIENYFLFDMSIPQMLEINKLGLNFFTRQSEYERELILYESAKGVWLDSFIDENYIDYELIDKHLNNLKEVCIVSPELHGRDRKNFWKRLYDYNIESDMLLLCTDYPREAMEYFNEK